MIYLDRNSEVKIRATIYQNLDASALTFEIEDNCFNYNTITATDISHCNNKLEATLTIPNLDLKRQYLLIKENDTLIQKVDIFIQEPSQATETVTDAEKTSVDDMNNNNSDNDSTNNNTDSDNLEDLTIDLTPEVVEAANNAFNSLPPGLQELMS